MIVRFDRHWFGPLSLLISLLLLCQVCPAPAGEPDVQEGPKAIYIIRHAEKPDSDTNPDLAPKGVKRADALSHVIPDHFCVPDFIWATAPSEHSRRPLETVQPLAHALHQKILDEYPAKDVEKLAHDLLTQSRYSGKTVLICWHHGEIPSLAKALGATDAPAEWKSEEFDRVWVLSFVNGKVQFKNLPQKSLPGDSEN